MTLHQQSMTVQEFLTQATHELQDAGIETARLDCLVMLEDTLLINRANVLAHPETIIDSKQMTTLNNFVTQRKQHLPLAYIRGKAAFYGRNFVVNDHVLVPRPETETMIELLQKLPLPATPTFIDLGCGSGCIGITAALEITHALVTLSDIDASAIAIATQNAQALGAQIAVLQQDLLTNTTQDYDVILANLPYVPTGYPINQAAGHEPALALFAGTDGLDLYHRMWQQIAGLKHQPSYVLTEALPEQHNPLGQLAKAAGYNLVQSDGFIQVFGK